MNWLGAGRLALVHDSAERALLPNVVFVGASVCGLKSHGEREARLPTTLSQSPATGLDCQHQFWRVSVFGWSHGSACSAASGGLAGNVRQRARNGGVVSRSSVPE